MYYVKVKFVKGAVIYACQYSFYGIVAHAAEKAQWSFDKIFNVYTVVYIISSFITEVC